MKKIEAIIRQNKLEDVEDALYAINVTGLTLYQVMGCGKQRGWREKLKDTSLKLNLLPKVKLELVVGEEMAEQVISVISKSAFTGEVGDGKIFISDLADAVRIRTGEMGNQAV